MISATRSLASLRVMRPREAASSRTSWTRARVSVIWWSRLSDVERARVVVALARLAGALGPDAALGGGVRAPFACGAADFAAVRRLAEAAVAGFDDLAVEEDARFAGGMVGSCSNFSSGSASVAGGGHPPRR